MSPGTPLDDRFAEFLTAIKPWRVYSQNQEEALLEAIFARIGTANKWAFECGAADGLFFSNTRWLIEHGWSAGLVECDADDYEALQRLYASQPQVKVAHRFLVPHSEVTVAEPNVTVGTLDQTLRDLDAPKDLDLLVLDVDSTEYYLLNSLAEYQPRVVIVEYAPDAEPIFIPELGGKGQAGHLALRYVAEARGYDVICRTPTNLVCVRKDLSHHLKGHPAAPASRIPQPSSFSVAAAPVEQSGERLRVAAAMSVPRLGYLDCLHQVTEVLRRANAPLFMGQGVFWHHALSRSVQRAMEWRDGVDAAADFILTVDYDTYATFPLLSQLVCLLYDNPEVDVIVPMQAKRCNGGVLAGTNGPVDMSQPLVPIVTGHFGFTLFRRRVFEQLRKPWFWEQPDKMGGWEEGRVDADIGFWRNVENCGLKAMLATQVLVGHGEEVVAWPRLEDGKAFTVYQTLKDWQETRANGR